MSVWVVAVTACAEAVHHFCTCRPRGRLWSKHIILEESAAGTMVVVCLYVHACPATTVTVGDDRGPQLPMAKHSTRPLAALACLP
jgi:hypothetical protein